VYQEKAQSNPSEMQGEGGLERCNHCSFCLIEKDKDGPTAYRKAQRNSSGAEGRIREWERGRTGGNLVDTVRN